MLSFYKVMNFKKPLVKTISAFVLLTALMMPVAIQLVHACEEGHDHAAFDQKTPNVHQDADPCGICDFQFASFAKSNDLITDLFTPQFFTKAPAKLASLLLHSFQTTNTQLRAPPVFS